MTQARIVVLLGPTGVGKTALALELADGLQGEIVSADSMQVYRGMDIGTAKPSSEERRRVAHHLIDVVDPDEAFDASRYLEGARAAIARLRAAGRVPFVVGGTGLYLRALLGGLIDGPAADEALRRVLREEMDRRGKAGLHERLRKEDPLAAARINPNDGVRVIRALEVLTLTGRSIVEWQRDHRFAECRYKVLKIGLRLPRLQLDERIDRRAEAMIARGFVPEVQGLLERGYGRDLKPMQALGYRQMTAYLEGRMDLEQALRELQRDTRRYARRQMTWFARDPEILWQAPDDQDAAAAAITRFGLR